MMARLLVHVEGQTEEEFVREMLAPHLYRIGYEGVSARLMGSARMRDRRGGIRGWESVRGDILNHLREDPGCFATTMVDYYGMHGSGDRAWPGRNTPGLSSVAEKAASVEQSTASDVTHAMGPGFNPVRFIPFVMMYEFEGLLFSDCARLCKGIECAGLVPQFQAIRNQFASPEEINDSPQTAPSKRITAILPSYQKPLHGVLAALEIGLEGIRAECPRFDRWLNRLEGIVRT